MPWLGSYEDLIDYLQRFANFPGDPATYDFNGVVHLMLATLDNLKYNALEAELEHIKESFNTEQMAFLLKLADHLREHDSD